MSLKESIELIYKQTMPQLNCYYVKPEFNDDRFESILNRVAEKEEPSSVILFGEAKSKGILSIFSSGAFLFTHKFLYLDDLREGMELSNISEILYNEEEKKGLLGSKKEGHLLLKTINEDIKDFKGNYATKEIASFLNCVIKEIKNEPIIEPKKKEFNHAEKISDIIKGALHENQENWKFMPNIPDKDINSLIIHYAKNEMKSSCSAYYKCSTDGILCFFNDSILMLGRNEDKSSKICNVVKYENLSSVTYKEREYRDDSGNVKSEKSLYVYDDNNSCVLYTYNNSLASKENANLLCLIISSEKGKTVEPNILSTTIHDVDEEQRRQQEQERLEEEEKEKLRKLEERKNLMKKYDFENKRSSIIENENEKEIWKQILEKWNNIFTDSTEWKSCKTSDNKNQNIQNCSSWWENCCSWYWGSDSYSNHYNLWKSKYSFDSREEESSYYLFENKGLACFIGDSLYQVHYIKDYRDQEKVVHGDTQYSFLYTPDVYSENEKWLYFSYYQNTPYAGSLRITMKSDGGIYYDYIAELEEKNDRFKSILQILGKEEMFDAVLNFTEQLMKIDETHISDINKNVSKELSDW